MILYATYMDVFLYHLHSVDLIWNDCHYLILTVLLNSDDFSEVVKRNEKERKQVKILSDSNIDVLNLVCAAALIL